MLLTSKAADCTSSIARRTGRSRVSLSCGGREATQRTARTTPTRPMQVHVSRVPCWSVGTGDALGLAQRSRHATSPAHPYFRELHKSSYTRATRHHFRVQPSCTPMKTSLPAPPPDSALRLAKNTAVPDCHGKSPGASDYRKLPHLFFLVRRVFVSSHSVPLPRGYAVESCI